MAARKGCCGGGCLVKLLITIVVIVVLIGGALWWVSAQTPDKLGFADTDLGGTTLREMGLADVKIRDLITVLRNLMNPDESSIVTNPYDPVEDKQSADEKSGDIGLPMDGDEPDYLYLLGEEPVAPENALYLEYSDTELAYIMDNIVSHSEDYDEDVEVIREMNASLAQVEITKGESIRLGMMVAVDISSIKNEIPMGGSLIPDRVFLNSVNTLTVDEQGIISTVSETIEINGMTDETSTVIINALFNALETQEGEEEPIEFFNDAFGAVFQRVVNNIGFVGATDLESGDEVTSSVVVELGEEGVEDHTICLITREQE